MPRAAALAPLSVVMMGGAGRSVDDYLDFPVLQQVHRIGPALGELEDAAHFEPGLFQHRRGAAGRYQFKAQGGELPGHLRDFILVRVADTDERAAAHRQRAARSHL